MTTTLQLAFIFGLPSEVTVMIVSPARIAVTLPSASTRAIFSLLEDQRNFWLSAFSGTGIASICLDSPISIMTSLGFNSIEVKGTGSGYTFGQPCSIYSLTDSLGTINLKSPIHPDPGMYKLSVFGGILAAIWKVTPSKL